MGAGGKREAQAQRTFRDVTGQRWAVAEHRIPAAEWTAADEESSRAGFGVGWLWFTSDAGSRRRLRLYPSWWERMSDDALEGLRSRAREASAGTA